MRFRATHYRPPAAALVASVLTLFVMGTNYCLLGAFATSASGLAPLACHAAPLAAAASERHDCCRGTTSESRESTPQQPGAGFPCCIQVAPPSTANSVKPDPGHATFVALDATLEPSGVVLTRRFAPEGRTGRPAESFPDLRRGRAPPLS